MDTPKCRVREFHKDKQSIITVEGGRGYSGDEGGVISFHIRAITASGSVNGRVEYSIEFPYLRSEHTFHIYKSCMLLLIDACNIVIVDEYKHNAKLYPSVSEDTFREWFEIVSAA